MAWTGFGGSDRNSGNSIGQNSGFGHMGPNDPYGGGSNSGNYGNTGGGNNGGNGRSGSSTNTAAAQRAAAAAAAQRAAAAAAAKAAAEKAAREEAARVEAARVAAEKEAARVATVNKQVQITNLGTTIATPEQAAFANSISGRINGFLGNVLGIGTSYNGTTVGGWGSPGTISGTLLGAISGARTGSALGPVGAILGGLAGMVSGSGVLAGHSWGELAGSNPNGPGGVTATGYGPGETLANGQRIGQANQKQVASTRGGTQTQTAENTAATKQLTGLVNALVPQSAKGVQQAGIRGENQYLNLLRGRYGKYQLSTGAQGSGTGLMGRTVGGAGALGGTAGRSLLG